MNHPWRADIISDAICPWCWIGKRHLEAALPLIGAPLAIHWRAFQLNPDMPPEGVARAEYRAAKFGSAERGRELDAQVTAAGARAGLDFRFDRQPRTPNTLAAHALIRAAGVAGLAVQDAVVEALFRAYFVEGQDIGDAGVLAAIGAGHGLTPDPDLEAIRAEDAGFRAQGISGVPSFALAGHVLFAGALPAVDMAEAFLRAIAILTERGLAPAA